MKVYVVLAHPEHQSFNGAMFRTAVETLASAGHEVETSDLHAVGGVCRAAEEYCRRAAVRGRDLIEGMRRPFGAVPLP